MTTSSPARRPTPTGAGRRVAGLLLTAAAALLLAGCSDTPAATSPGAAPSASAVADPAGAAPTTAASTPAASTPAAPTTAAAPASTPGTLVISGFVFMPPTLSVSAGSTVTVDNQDGANHTVVAVDGSFDSGNIPGRATGSFTAPSTPGTYAYKCSIHPFMTGTLTVT